MEQAESESANIHELLVRMVNRLEAVIDEGEALTRNGAWHRTPEQGLGWKRSAMLASADSFELIEEIKAALLTETGEIELQSADIDLPAISDLLGRQVLANARLEQLIESIDIGHAFADGEDTINEELRKIEVKNTKAEEHEKLWEAVENEHRRGPARRWLELERDAPPRMAKRLKTAVITEARKHRSRFGETRRGETTPETRLGTADHSEFEVNHRAVRRLAKGERWKRRDREEIEETDLESGYGLSAEDTAEGELLLTRLKEEAHDDRERLYLQLLKEGATKTEAQKASELPRSTAQALERRLRRLRQ